MPELGSIVYMVVSVLKILNYSLAFVNSQIKLTPNFVTGFTDAEGSFIIIIVENPTSKICWTVQAKFQINLHKKDRAILELRKSYFGVGQIYVHGENSLQYRVTSLKDITTIISHFDKYSLITPFGF